MIGLLPRSNHWAAILASLLLFREALPFSTYQTIRARDSSIKTALFDLPKVIVFDLDATLWTPELYQLRRLQRANQTPVAGKDVTLFEGAKKILDEILPSLASEDKTPMLAIASRTQSVAWAENLIDQFELRDRFHAIEIFPAHKTKHFARIQQKTKVPYHEMIFFDDARDGKYGNCEPVAALGVFCVHCPQGLVTADIFDRALDLYRNKWDKTPNTILEWDGKLTTNVAKYEQPPRNNKRTTQDSNQSQDDVKQYNGVVKMLRPEKRFGFIRYRSGNDKNYSQDIFFHFNNLVKENGVAAEVEEGDQVTFSIQNDSAQKNKAMAVNVALEHSHDKSKVVMRAFSMNQPFAALLANGYKTLETRNGTMFTQFTEGTQMLLHVGQRTYPDGGKHEEIMKTESGLDDEEIERLKKLPDGYSRGSLVAIVELGRTYETSLQERSQSEFEQNVAARGRDSGRIVTEIKRVQYLKKPIKQRGEAGVFKVRIDADVIPDGWSVPTQDEQSASDAYATITG